MFDFQIQLANDVFYCHYRGGPSHYYANNGVRIEVCYN